MIIPFPLPAPPGGDFTLTPPPPAAFLFTTDQVSQSISLNIVDDTLLELEEMFALSLFKNTSTEGVDVDAGRGVTDINIIDNESEWCMIKFRCYYYETPS